MGISMTLFDVLALLGGLAMFLYGMTVMSNALEKRAGSRLKGILEKLTKNTFSGFLLGLGITAVIQSSSATTVMVVGFVNSGVMTLKQSIGVIMGANLGTSATSWILSLSGIDGESTLVRLLKPDSFVPILAFIGVLMLMFSKKSKIKDTAPILLGFAVLMYGMEFMSDAVAPLKDSEAFKNILVLFANPILGVIVGTVFTAIIQSSSASVGVLQALTLSCLVPYSTVVPIVMGQNIGTCVSAMISSIGTSKNARRAAVVHLSFNVIATLILLPAFYILNYFIGFDFLTKNASPVGVAVVHTVFKIAALAILMPASNLLLKLAHFVVRDGKSEDTLKIPDDRLFTTPAIALSSGYDSAITMGRLAHETVEKSFELIDAYTEDAADKIIKNEDIVDKYEDGLGSYFVKLSRQDLAAEDANEVSMLLHLIGDFERISDHAKNVCESCTEMNEKKLSFSNEAIKELTVLRSAVKEAVNLAFKAFETRDSEMAMLVEPIEQVVDRLKKKIRSRHIERLQNGECTIELGFILSDLLGNFERVADHASNIAVSVIELKQNNFDSHAYLNEVKHSSEKFDSLYQAYKKKYAI